MIIYLEGVDELGKSTLREQLVVRLEQLKYIRDIKVVPNGEELIPTSPFKPNRMTADELLNKFYTMANQIRTVYICDSGPISDIIDRTFDEHDPVISFEKYWMLWVGSNHLITTVHCDSDAAETMRLKRGDQDPKAVANHKAIRNMYNQIMPMFGAYRYDVTTFKDAHDHQKAINAILAQLWAGVERCKRIRAFTMRLEDES